MYASLVPRDRLSPDLPGPSPGFLDLFRRRPDNAGRESFGSRRQQRAGHPAWTRAFAAPLSLLPARDRREIAVRPTHASLAPRAADAPRSRPPAVVVLRRWSRKILRTIRYCASRPPQG